MSRVCRFTISSIYTIQGVFLAVLMSAVTSFSEPMEPAISTVFILLDGMKASAESLTGSNADPCKSYEESFEWGKTGFARYLQEDITNSKATIYSRSFKKTTGSPNEVFNDFAHTVVLDSQVTCGTTKQATPYYDSNSHQLFYPKNGTSIIVNTMLNEALQQWFDKQLVESGINVNTPHFLSHSLQKQRGAWNGTNPKTEFPAIAANIDLRLKAWINSWEKTNGTLPSFSDLKKHRPELIPSRYVVISNGMGGLVAREYIQSPLYQGEIDKVVFINTPHEGTGFADQMLFSQNYVVDVMGDIALGVPLAVLASISPIGDLADGKISEFLESLVQGLAMKAASSFVVGGVNNAKYGYSVYDPALWYLAQDADRRDMKYRNLISLWNPEANGVQIDKEIGALQYLNMNGMNSPYREPRYRLVYSYGLPSLGNGRRLSLDYLVQKKSHVTQENFNNALSKIITDKINEEYSDAVRSYLDTSVFSELTEKAINDIVSNLRIKVKQIRIKVPGERLTLKLNNMLQNAVNSLNVGKIVELGTDKALDFAVNKGIESCVQSIVENPGINIENLDQETVDFVAAAEFIIPTSFSANVMSPILPSLSPKPKGMDFEDGLTLKGQGVMAGVMANGSLNFFDQGTFDVPAYSAYGENVAAFSGPNVDIQRNGYSLIDLDLSSHSKINNFAKSLKAIGAVKEARDIVNTALFWGCMAQPNKLWKDICKTTKQVMHYASLVNEAASAGAAATSMIGSLDDTKTLAIEAMVSEKKVATFKSVSPSANGEVTITYKDIDELLFEKPHINVQSVQGTINGTKRSLPLLLFSISGDSVTVPEISDLTGLGNVYGIQDVDSLFNKVIPFSADLASLRDVDYTSSNWYRNLTIKNVLTDSSMITRQVRRSVVPAFTAANYIREFRFQVDDLRPDQLWQIKLDFNALTQIALERDSSYNWKGYIRVNGGTWSDLGSLPRPPVDENGLFVFRPEEFLSRTGKNGIPLAVISQLEQDGPNVISVMLVNRIGLQSNQQFSYYFTATAPLIREGWPNALQSVSALNQVRISLSNLGNPYDADSAKVRLIHIGNDSTSEVMGFVQASISQVKADSSSWGDTWKIQCNLGSVIDSLNLKNGEYILQWKVATASRTEGRQVSWYTMNTTVFVDSKSPELAIQLPTKSLTGTESDGVWAHLIIPATSDDKSLREVRTFLTYSKSGATDSVQLFHNHNVGSSGMGISWLDSIQGLPEGAVRLHVQAIDYAEPSESIASSMDSIRSKDSVVVKSSWNALVNAHGAFVSGVNGVEATSMFWIDKTAPSIIPANSVIRAVNDSTVLLSQRPSWNASATAGTVSLNSNQLLSLGLEINEPLLQRVSNSISIQVVFRDSVQSIRQTYTRMHDIADSSHFVFNEPNAQKLADGIYRISVILTDEAGNSSGVVHLPITLVVDRHTPVILDVLAGEPVYSSRADVDSANAYISQAADYALNRSNLKCFQRLITPDSISSWVALSALDTVSKSGVEKSLYSYSMKNLVGSSSNGRWSTQFGCFDAAGNFGTASDVFGVGNRYPQITYPTSSTIQLFSADIIQIRGVAPNPVVPNGNELTSEYKLEWRKVGDSAWTSQGVTLSTEIVSSLNRDLAIWNRTSVIAGEYELRLSVRGCKDSANVKCNWVSDIQTISLDDVDSSSIAAKPTIAVSVPTHQIPGDSAKLIQARLVGLADGSKWTMSMKIQVSDPWDTVQKVIAKSAHFDSVAISPFSGVPTGNVPNGFSIWQAADGEWTLKWKGHAIPKNSQSKPSLRLGYTQGSVVYTNPTPSYQADDSSIVAPSVTIGSIKTVGYDRIRTWSLDTASSQELTVRFKTDKPFMVDLSSVDSADQYQYWGVSRLNYASSGMGGIGIPYIYVDLNNYASCVAWNGLTSSGLYPGSPKAKVQITATENIEGGRVVTADAEWGLALGAVKIVSDDNGPGQFIVSKAMTASGADTLKRLGNIGYQFGIVGQAAKVSAVVKDSLGMVVRTLMTNEPILAGSSHNSQIVQWDGVSDNGFAVINPGNYSIQVTANDLSGNTDNRSYPFAMKFAGGLLEAPSSESGGSGVLASLSMDEAFLDSTGFRFIGMPDYLLKADLAAKTLPLDQRTFAYHWDLSGTQEPSFYRANRFSLGVRRARDQFPVTLVILMATQGRDFVDSWWTDNCDSKDLKVAYRMWVKKVLFNRNADGGLYWDSELNLDPNLEIVAYDSWSSGTRYPIKVAVQILPEFAYDSILTDKKTFNGNTEFRGNLNKSWSEFWDEKYNKELEPWFFSWQNPKFWSSELQFYENSGADYALGDELNSKTCTPSDDKSGFGPLVCGAENSEQESKDNLKKTLDSFNPHQNMLKLDVAHIDGKSAYGTGNFSRCWSNEHSKTNVKVDFKLKVQPDYWEPVFGYNNLANRYMRFDHTNKTLYGDGSYFAANTEIQNYYNGSTWVHDSNYGLVSAFEAQRYTFENSPSNPLLFADEIGNEKMWDGRIQYRFFGADENGTHFRTIMRTNGFAVSMSGFSIKVDTINDFGTISSNGNPTQSYSFKNYFLNNLEFIVAPEISPANAVKQDPSVYVDYPYTGKWIPKSLGNQTLCSKPGLSLRDIDDQEHSCYQAYPGAARIHYNLNDWTEPEWSSAFVNAGDNTLKNPVSVASNLGYSVSPISLNNIVDLSNWGPTGSDIPQVESLSAQSSDYSSSKKAWWISPSRLASAPEINPDYGHALNIDKTLVVDDYAQKSSKWVVIQSNGAVTSIQNPGESIKDSLRYIRSKDTTVQDMASLRPLGHDVISEQRLQNQNASLSALNQAWVRDIKIKNPQIWSRLDSTIVHPYFGVSVTTDSVRLDVERTDITPDIRPDEMATLRGRVPGENAMWNLAYLLNGQLVSLASGTQSGNPPSQMPYPMLKELNANRLQGNTSFFLTYGGQDAGNNLYFKQLDVHMGHLLNPQQTDLIQSMYGNASVQFPAGAFKTPVDITVRTASLSDFNYRVFNGLDPVGTVVEVLPSHVFPTDNPALWPRVSIVITKETLKSKNQNPLEAKIYKPDFANKQIVPLEEQEIGFFLNRVLQQSCSVDNGNCNSVPADALWDMVKISGKTPTFSAFMVMDEAKADRVKPATDTSASDTATFACGTLSTSDTLWMGLVNGYLEYPYPCQGSANTLLQLRNGSEVIAEHQALVSQNIRWSGTLQDIPATQLNYGSRLAVYGSNGKTVQMAGSTVHLDTVAPQIMDVELLVRDQAPQKLLQLDASISDSMSGVSTVKIEFYWAGKLVETRLLSESQTIVEDFSLDRIRQTECPGCQAQFFITVEDKGHNYVRKEVRSSVIYPYPTSLALWYPLAEGYGTTAMEALGSGLDLQLAMSRPWLYGQRLYFYSATDSASPSAEWSKAGSSNTMSVEFKLRPGSLNKDKSYSLITWNNATPWNVSVKNGTDLAFQFAGHNVTFPAVIGIAKSQSHFVISIKDNSVTLFKDGTLSQTLDLGQTFAWNMRGKPTIGHSASLPAMVGDFMDVRFYTKDLSAEEIYWLYAGSLNIQDSDFTVVRATALSHSGLVLDQSCEVPGKAFLRQGYPATGLMSWSIAPGSGNYRLYLLSRGFVGQSTEVEVYLDGVSKGVQTLPSNGLWESNALTSLTLSLSSGTHVLALKPIGSTGIAGLAIANAQKNIPSKLVRWNSQYWTSPTPVVDVWMQYNSYADKTWVRPQFRLSNLTDRALTDVRLRYYFRGEGQETQPVSFYPQASMSVYADAGDVLFAELPLTEAIPAWGSAYWGNGPQIGLHRPDTYGPWYSEDDPSFEPYAVSGSLYKTDKIALLDAQGNLLNSWSCFEAGGPAVLNTPKVRALGSDKKLGSTQSSLVNLVVENVGSQAIHGFEARYYFRELEGKKPVWAVYNNQSADTALVNDGNGLYHVSFKYRNTILNPGERTEFGNGAQFELHHADWTSDWNSGDDPSHADLSSTLTPSDSLVVLDLNGNLLWGKIPTASSIAVQDQNAPSPHIMVQGKDGISIDVVTAGTYSLIEVNAAGLYQQTLFSGTLRAGAQFISTTNLTLSIGNYLVLRRGSVVVDQILVK